MQGVVDVKAALRAEIDRALAQRSKAIAEKRNHDVKYLAGEIVAYRHALALLNQ